jgi:hypothetical protein
MPKDNGFQMPDMMAFTEKNFEQARTAFENLVAATQQAVTQAQSGMREMGELAIRNTQRNIATSFEFAQKLTHAKDAKEMADLHAEYIRTQIQALTEQAQELSRQLAKAGTPPTSS